MLRRRRAPDSGGSVLLGQNESDGPIVGGRERRREVCDPYLISAKGVWGRPRTGALKEISFPQKLKRRDV